LKITVLYVGTSLLAPLRRAESDINKRYSVPLEVTAHNCGAPLDASEWETARNDIAESEIVFVIHVTEGENAARIIRELESSKSHKTIVAFNCMPDLMRCMRMGNLDFAQLMKRRAPSGESESSMHRVAKKLGSWMHDFVKGSPAEKSESLPGAKRAPASRSRNTAQYLTLISRLPSILKFVPRAGKLGDIKNYLMLFCYFLQPTDSNIRSMILYAIKTYSRDAKSITGRVKISAPETMPTVAIYHPDSSELFDSFDRYQKWSRGRKRPLDPGTTIGLLLMRPQIISNARGHYDALIRAIEAEGLSVIPAISTFMDNRDACSRFFVNGDGSPDRRSRVSQIISLTGFSFVGGPAMNDSEAAVEFLKDLNVPFRSAVSLDVQTIESWSQSKLGLNPIQTAMQVAIPEIDGATEPFVFGGLTARGTQPEPIEDRCKKIARRIARWNRLRTVSRNELRIALVLYCFPPNKGNLGTAADLDVFPSLWETLSSLRQNGYAVDLPENAEALRELVLEGNSPEFGTIANVAYSMDVDEYRRLCPFVSDVEREWGPAPGNINSNGRQILMLGAQLGNVFLGVQPTFGYEGDPMRLLAAESGAPHHGFMGLYTFLEKVFCADAVVHVGTHGALEFMPGKQAGLSERCWPDRLIGELPNVYMYSVNNPSEGTIAKRRSYAELISYLTPPIESAGLYKELASLKELVNAYRGSRSESERKQLFEAIDEKSRAMNL
jgi:magnesium chelatase subunit H